MPAPQWLVNLTLDSRGFIDSMQAARQATTEFTQALHMLNQSGIGAVMSLYQTGPMLQQSFQGLTGTIRNAVTSFAEFESSQKSLEFLAGNIGHSMDEVNLAVKQLTSDGLMTASGAMHALKDAMTLGVGLDTAVAGIEIFKNSLLAAGKSADDAFAIITSLRTGQSQRLDEYGITKNINQMYKEQVAVMKDLIGNKEKQKTADAEYLNILKKLEATGDPKKALAGDENIKLQLIFLGTMQEVMSTYTAYNKLQAESARVQHDKNQAVKNNTMENLVLVETLERMGKAYKALDEIGAGKLTGAEFVSKAQPIVEKEFGDSKNEANAKRSAELAQEAVKRGIISKTDDAKSVFNFEGSARALPNILDRIRVKVDQFNKDPNNKVKIDPQRDLFNPTIENIEKVRETLGQLGVSSMDILGVTLPGAAMNAQETFNYLFRMLQSNLQQLTVDFGGVFAKWLTEPLAKLVDLVRWLRNLDAQSKENIATMAALGTGILGAFAGIFTGIIAVTQLTNAFQFLGNAMQAAGTQFGALLNLFPGFNQAARGTQAALRGLVQQQFETGVADLQQQTTRTIASRITQQQNTLGRSLTVGESDAIIREEEAAEVPRRRNLQANRDAGFAELTQDVTRASGVMAIFRHITTQTEGAVVGLGTRFKDANFKNMAEVWNGMGQAMSGIGSAALGAAQAVGTFTGKAVTGVKNFTLSLGTVQGWSKLFAGGVNILTGGIGNVIVVAGRAIPMLGSLALTVVGASAAFIVIGAAVAAVVVAFKAVTSAVEKYQNIMKETSGKGDGSAFFERMSNAAKIFNEAMIRIRTSVDNFFKALGMGGGLEEFGAKLAEIGAIIMNVVSKAFEHLMGRLVLIIKAFQDFAASETGQAIGNAFIKLGQIIGNVVGFAWNITQKLFELIIGGIARILQLAGHIPGLAGLGQAGTDMLKAIEAGKKAQEEYLNRTDADVNKKKAEGNPGDANRNHKDGKDPGANDVSPEEAKKKLDEEIARAKENEKLAILNAKSDAGVVAAKKAYYSEVTNIYNKYKSQIDEKERLKYQITIAEARKALFEAEATALEHRAQREKAAAEAIFNLQKTLLEAEAAATNARSKLVGDKLAIDLKNNEVQHKLAQQERLIAIERVKNVDIEIAAARKRVAAGGEGSTQAENRLKDLEEQKKLLQAQAQLASAKLADSTTTFHRQKVTLTNQNTQAGEDFYQQRIDNNSRELGGALKGGVDGSAYREMQNSIFREMDAYRNIVNANPAGDGDRKGQQEQYNNFLNIYKSSYAEIIKQANVLGTAEDRITLLRENQAFTLKDIKDAQQEVMSTEIAMRDQVTKNAELYQKRTEAEANYAKVSSRKGVNPQDVAQAKAAQQAAVDAEVAGQSALNRLRAQSIEAKAKESAASQQAVAVQEQLIRSQMELLSIEQSRLRLAADFAATQAQQAQSMGLYTEATARFKEEIDARTSLIGLAQEEVRLLREKKADSKDIAAGEMKVAEAQAAALKSRANAAGSADKASAFGLGIFGNFNQEKAAVADAADKEIADADAILNDKTSTKAQKEQAQVKKNAGREVKKQMMNDMAGQMLTFPAIIEANFDKLGKDVGQAVGGAFKEAIETQDWSLLQQNIAVNVGKAGRSFIGQTVSDFISKPIENTFAKVSGFLKDGGKNLAEAIGGAAKMTNQQIGQLAGAIDMAQTAFALGMTAWATMVSSGGAGEQQIKEGAEISDQTTEVRGVVAGETNVGIGKLNELFDPVAAAMKMAADQLMQVAQTLQGIFKGQQGGVIPENNQGGQQQGQNLITLNLTVSGTLTVIADIPAMQKELNLVIQNTVRDMVKKEITDRLNV